MTLPSKAALEVSEAILRDLLSRKGFKQVWWDCTEEIQEEIRTSFASLIDAHPMVRRLVDEQLWGKSNQECSACLNSVPGQHEVDCIIPNWQPQAEKGD